MRRVLSICLAVCCGLAIVGYLTRDQRISTVSIGVTKNSEPYCHLDFIEKSPSDITVRITISNPTNEPIGVGRTGLPEWNINSTSLFDIQRDGTVLGYRGRYVNMRSSDILQIEPGTKASVGVSLARAGYDVSGKGEFAIVYRGSVSVGGLGHECLSNVLTVQK
jgi:hypothetical protein